MVDQFDIITNPVRIRDLMLFKYDEVLNIIKDDIELSKNNGIYLGELFVNKFVYESKSTDLLFIRLYIKILNSIAIVFNDIFSDQIYNLRLDDLLDDKEYTDIYNKDIFHQIFNEMNNEFNTFVDDLFIFDEFLIYGSEISLEVILIIYEIFNQNIVSLLSAYIDRNILININSKRTVRYFSYIYDKLFEQFENVAGLPFY